MFLRFVRLLMIIFLLFTWSTFIIIIPANSAYIESTLHGLDRISWSKCVRTSPRSVILLTSTSITDPKDEIRFCAHVVVVYILTGKKLYYTLTSFHSRT